MNDKESVVDVTEEPKKKFFNREDRESVKKTARKVISAARAGLELYFAAKKKDPITLGLGLLSTYDALENILAKEGETLHQKITSMGYVDVVRGMEKLVFSTLVDLHIPYEVKLSERGDGENNKALMFDICGTKIYVLIEGTYIAGIYAKDEDLFVDAFSKLLSSKLGSIVAINVYNENWSAHIKLSSTEIPLETYVSTIDEKQYCDNIRKFRAMGLNRSSLLFGNPGCGKTTFAAKIAKNLEGRLVIIDAQALNQASRQGWSLIFQKILRLLSPTVILFDDIDRLGEEELGFLLSMIENLNKFKDSGEIIIMASINDLTQLPDAMKRPGRFDEIIVFEDPNYDQRKTILLTYLDHFKMRLANMYVDEMAALTEGLSPAYLKEIAQQATVASYERIPKIIVHMKTMLGIDVDTDEDDDEDYCDEDPVEEPVSPRDKVSTLVSRLNKRLANK